MNWTKEIAIERLIALDELTRRTGVKTYKTYNTILAQLPPDLLMEVAVELKKHHTLVKALTEPNLKGTTVNAAGTLQESI